MSHAVALSVLMALVLLCWAGSAAAAEPTTRPSGAREAASAPRVLVFTMTRGFRHDAIPLAGKVFGDLAQQSRRFEVVVSEDAAQFDPQNLASFDAVVFCLTSGEPPLNEAQKQALVEFVRGGRGLVGIHSATDTLYSWPEFGQMMGAYFDGHPWDAGQTVKIRVERPDHPIAAPFGSASFPLTEEIYQFKEPYDRNQLTVLLSLDTSGTDMSKQGIKRKDNDFGLAWIKPYGQGRVFYTALGHNQAVWGDPRFQAHVLAGVLWSMGRR